MNQLRMRKAMTDTGRSRPLTKASGDAPKECQKTKERHRTKNKIPKSMRYDLENALVGLCDVWFEDIKPHLLRNNIKVHVHGSETAAGGDRGRLPPGQSGCSHLDPGAAFDLHPRRAVSYAGSSSMQPTASKARSRRPLQPPSKLQSLQPSPTTISTPKNQRRRYEKNMRSSAVRESPPSRPWRRRSPPSGPPRPTKSHSTSSHVAPWVSSHNRSHSALPSPPPPGYNHTPTLTRPFLYKHPRQPPLKVLIPSQLVVKSKMKDASTQTDDTLLLNGKSLKRRNASPSQTRVGQMLYSLVPRPKSPSSTMLPIKTIERPRKMLPALGTSLSSRTQQLQIPSQQLHPRRKQSRAPVVNPQPGRRLLAPCHPDNLLAVNNQLDDEQLLQDELFNLIRATNDVSLKQFSESPRSTEHAATYVLSQSKKCEFKTRPPWK